MSRLLIVADDPRAVPFNEVCWWRKALRYNPETMNVAETHIDRYPDPWACYVDYWDGLNDWSFPYDYRVDWEHQWDTRTSRPLSVDWYLDILAAHPPGELGTGWRQLTPFGDPVHPRKRRK